MPANFRHLVGTELFLLRKRPSTWTILGIWLVVTAIFAYVFEYVSYRNGSSEFANSLGGLLPASFAQNISEGIPFYGGSLVLILGVLSIGSEFGWGTWKTLFTQRPGRSAIFGAKMTALGIALIPFVVLSYAIGAVASVTIATVEDAAISWPSATSIVESMLSGWLIMAVWASAGVLLAMASRGTSLAIGVGILWGLAFEGLLSAFATSVSWLEWIVDLLLRANGYSLVRSISGAGEGGAGADGPGQFTGPYVSGGQALAMLVLYLVVFLGGSLWLLRRRDVV
jgi:ABC-type transport system involved in multi-copper enzyme maturation permease subunit